MSPAARLFVHRQARLGNCAARQPSCCYKHIVVSVVTQDRSPPAACLRVKPLSSRVYPRACRSISRRSMCASHAPALPRATAAAQLIRRLIVNYRIVSATVGRARVDSFKLGIVNRSRFCSISASARHSTLVGRTLGLYPRSSIPIRKVSFFRLCFSKRGPGAGAPRPKQLRRRTTSCAERGAEPDRCPDP